MCVCVHPKSNIICQPKENERERERKIILFFPDSHTLPKNK